MKYIILSLIAMYIYNTYVAPISRSVLQKKQASRDQKQAKQEYETTLKKNSKVGDFIDYEEIKD